MSYISNQGRRNQGVIPLWKPSQLDVSPFNLPVHYTLTRNAYQTVQKEEKDSIYLERDKISFENSKSNACINLPIYSFEGLALRLSPKLNVEGFHFAVSINLHHDNEHYCVPLFFSADMEFVSARLNSWSDTLQLPILLPCNDGSWNKMDSLPGRLSFKEARLCTNAQSTLYRFPSQTTHRQI